MKTLRLITALVFVASAMMSFSNTNHTTSIPDEQVVYLNLEQAHLVPGLVTAMHRQLSSSFLHKDQQVYTVDVRYAGYTYRISGTYNQWVLFFWPKIVNVAYTHSDRKTR